jgi:amino acid adenylation domain-containing protein
VSPADRTESTLAALAALSLEQRAVLERLLGRERALEVRDDGPDADLAPIAPRADRSALPLSFSQQRLWFLDQLSPGDPAYNIHGAVRLRGLLDIAALARGLRAVTARHEVLRSRFTAVEGRPEQGLVPPGGPPLPVVDLRGLGGLAAERREAEVLRLAMEEARRPFDLAQGPLLRTALLRLDGAESILLVTMHHIVSDGWSMGVFVRELAALYAGAAAPLPPLPLQYADFAAWQRRRLAGGRLAREVDHWRSRLAGVPELCLPAEPFRTRTAGGVPIVLPARLVERLKEVAHASGASLFMILLAAFEAVLLRWSGQRDFAVGTPIANRTRPEIEGLIGFFVNTLVLRADLAGDPPFRGLLERVRDVCLDAYAHQDLPFEKLVEELQPERRLGRNPLFSSLLALQNTPQSPLALPGLALDLLPLQNGTARFDLTLDLAEGEQGISGILEHGPAGLSPLAAQRMAGHFRVLLDAAAASPGRPLSALPLLTAAERHQTLIEWAGAEEPVPAAGFSELFAAQAARSAAEVAVVCGGETLTYGELARRSNQLAWHLRRLGAGPEAVVAIAFERSLEMVIGLFAILGSGAAYLPIDPPIDPHKPRERQSFMLEDCGAALLLTRERWAGSFRRPGLRVLCLDGDLSAVAGEPETAPPRLGAPGNALAFLYTSGSTGRPKATVVEERGFLNLCHWFRGVCGLTASTRALLGFAFSFDAAFKNIVVPLLAGGRLVLANPGPFDAAEMEAAIRDEGVTFLNTTPSQMLPVLALAATDTDGFASLASLRGLILGGEAAAWDELLPWLASGRCHSTLTNMYGPSECSDTITFHRVTPAEIAAEACRIPVGRAAANVRLAVVDADFQPLPSGVPGELCAAGICLARGYFARPELTAEKFVPDPFAPGGERMYRTGDLARWSPDGNLELLGRLDDQVKIRGIRVEPAEVEAALREHPGVRNAVVLARPADGAGEKRLVAWIVTEGALSSQPSSTELRGFLESRLPAALIPAAFVFLPAFPLNARGKLDRAALPDPDSDPDFDPEMAVPPAVFGQGSDPGEELMAALFAEVLGRPSVGVHDNFFHCGGHSLLATRLVSRVRAAFGAEIPVRSLFEAPTPARLAAAVRGLEGPFPALPPLRRRAGNGPAPLSLAQQRLWVLHQLTPDLAAYHIPAALRLRGALHVGALERALAEITVRHAALRTHFPVTPETGGEPVQEVDPPSNPGLAALPAIDLSALPAARGEEEARRITGEEARRPFDLERGPLLRLRLLRLGAADHLLLITVQHLVSDGWSASIFLRELSLLYTAFVEGRTAALPELPVQYTDYAAWQREGLRGEILDALLGYWRERLAGVPQILDLPTDRPRPLAEPHAAATVPLDLAPPLLDGLRGLGRAAGATLYMVLLAGFQAVLGRWAGEESVSVGTPVAGRDRLETEELIGFFVNTLVIHTDLAGAPESPSSPELIGRVRESVLGAFAHQHLPFEKLVEALNPERDPRWSPLVQVLFALQTLPPGEPRLHGLEVERLESDPGAAQFDLAASLVEPPAGAGLAGIAGSLRYRTALWDPTTMQRLVAGFEVLLAAMVAESGRPVAELPLLGAAARHQAVVEWSGLEVAERSESPGSTLPALVAAQARRVPDRPAVVLDGAVLSYAELDRRAGRVAQALRRLGVGPEVRVAIRLERSPDLLTAILGVLKAGGAYVPLDPAAPRERLELLLDDAAPAVLLTASAHPGSPARAVPVLTLEEAFGAAGADPLPPEPAPDQAPPDQLAYVIYTSGSTGRPKGTLVRHGALGAFARGLRAAVAELRAPGPLRLSLNAPFAFDASLQQIVQLAAGHTLWIVPAEARRDGEPMAAYLRAACLDGMDCTPSQLDLLLAAIDASGCPPRFVLVGGEAIPPALWERLASHPRTRFYNVYGPTECTVDATARRIERRSAPDIGRPLAGYRAYLLDFAGQPVPAGARGEIWIGGAALARGYWQRAALTADRFRPDPFSGEPGARLYRTGDLGRWLPERGIESLGRADQQIKVRGFRIEPGEIEAVLAAHPDVAEAAVGLRQGPAREPRLVAWVTAAALSRPPSSRELRRWLAERLPEPMVPAVVAVLDALPRTASGKLDRRALPEPPRERSGRDTAAVLPPGDLLPRLLDLWRDVLGVPEVHPDDSLFDLGGHSLSVARLVTRIAEAFGILLPARTLFIAPTPRGIAEALRTAGREAGRLPRIVPAPRDRPVPLSFAQQRLWMLHQLTPGLTAYHLPAALRLRGGLDTAALRQALEEIVRRHETLRTRFPVRASGDGGEPVQEIDPAGPVPLPEIDLTALPDASRERELRRAAAGETARIFDLAAGPLLRLRLFRLGAGDRVLLLVIHHLVSDGWSAAIFLRELAVLYAAFSQGEPSPLPELPVQYADYTVAQREWDTGILTLQLRYWTDHLTGSPQRLDLPADHPRPVLEDDTGAAVAFPLAPGLVTGLRGLGRAARTVTGEGATLYMILIAAFQALLARYAGRETVNVGTPVARRSRQEIESLIGFFVNTLVLRTDLGDAPTGRTLIGRVRDTVLGAFAHQDLPFERLVEALRPDRDPRWTPLFQAVFALHNVPREEPHLAGLEVTRLDLGGSQSVQFDLVAAVVEEDGGGARGTLAYRTALYAEATVRRLADHYLALLAALAADPDRPVADLPILGEGERFQILHEWSGAHGVQLLDARRQPVPAGARGAVWAGGTATGTFARWSAAGNLEPLDPPSPLVLSAQPVRSPRAADGTEPPRDSREERLLALFREVLDIPDATVHDDFFELGGHSLAAYRLATRAGEALGVQLPVREIFATPSVAELAARLDRMNGNEPAGLVIALQPRGSRPPFFCLPPGGGGISPYRELALRLEADRPFLALRAPGLEEGEEPPHDLGAVTGLYLEAILRAQPEGPWHLGGWSTGAILAFEVARRLRAAGGEVAALVLFDPPDLPLPVEEPDDAAVRAAFAREAEANRIDGSAALERRLRVFRAGVEALRGYTPEPWSGPLTVLEAAERPAPAAVWREIATAVHTLSGSHTTILQPPFVDELARRLRDAL